MPRYSERKKLIAQLNKLLKVMILTDDEETEEFQELFEFLCELKATRNLNARNYV